MTIISNDPTLWPVIGFYRINGYYAIASSIVVVYDWILTFGQEFDQIWRQRWSLISVLYLCVRYIGLLVAGFHTLYFLPVSITDTGCTVLFFIQNWMSTVVNIMLGVIMIARLYAMYQQSRKMLVFLVLIFSAAAIASVVIIIMQSSISTVSEEIILSGYSQCIDVGNDIFIATVTWIFGAVWEIVALCLAVWIAIKHFREVSTGRTIGDCFTALIKSHVFYFASFAVVTCLTLGTLSPQLSNASAVVADFYNGLLQISSAVQMFVLGPRLVLSIRKFNAKVVTNSDEATAMTSIDFRERTRMLIDNDV